MLIKPATTKEGVEHGRYQIKKAAPALVPEVEVKRSPANTEPPVEQKVQEVVPTAVPAVAPAPVAETTETPEKVEEKFQEPSISAQAQSLMDSDSQKVINLYKEQIHPDDIRNNRLEIQGSPALVYNGSQSNYSYRSYSSFFSAMELASNVWMTPSIGLSGRILFSFGATLSGDSTTSSGTATKYEDLDLGLKFRRFFGMSRLANSMEFNFLFSESKMSTPSDNTHRPQLLSSGAGIKMTARIPTSGSFSWVFGGSFFPRLRHEEGKTGILIRSGSPGENTRLGVNVGGEVKFSRESQMIYDFSVATERNTFDGTASPADPEKLTSPTNVSVTNTFVMFSFGYRWGR
jgi:hypothetical protein